MKMKVVSYKSKHEKDMYSQENYFIPAEEAVVVNRDYRSRNKIEILRDSKTLAEARAIERGELREIKIKRDEVEVDKIILYDVRTFDCEDATLLDLISNIGESNALREKDIELRRKIGSGINELERLSLKSFK